MNPIVTIAVVLTLVLFTGIFAAMSVVDFLPDELLGPDSRRHGSVSERGQPG